MKTIYLLISASTLLTFSVCAQHISDFVSVTPQAQTSSLLLPPTHTFQQIAQETNPFPSGYTIPNLGDFTCYVPHPNPTLPRSGVISLNHETTPAAISNINLHFNCASGTWNVDDAFGVNLAPVYLSSRFCSGGLTPWGTVISVEEATSNADGNNDGYLDYGWLVETNPFTHQVASYPPSNTQSKLWAFGRASRENICIANDQKTAYTGADDLTKGFIYKFVATNPQNLSQGTLYALKLNPDLSTGYWITVPNSTQTEQNATATYSSTAGATNFSGVEDIEIAPNGFIYFTAKYSGNIYRFRETNNNQIADFDTFVVSKTYTITTQNGTVQEAWGTGNDNLAFDDEANLWVLQDGSRNHIWLVHNDHTPDQPHISLFATTPIGSEPTGITFTPDYRYLFLTIMHPSTANTAVQLDAANQNVTFNKTTTLVIARKEQLGSSYNSPPIGIVGDANVCNGDIAQYTTTQTIPDATYQWSVANGTILSGQGTSTIQVQWHNITGSSILDQLSVQWTRP
jgi:secreted PhoX family phosphatase